MIRPVKPLLLLSLFSLATGAMLSASAQQKQAASAPTSSTITPAVQRLYAEAHEDQSHGDAQGAIAKYEEILKQAPRLAPAYNNLGMLYFNTGDYAQAAETLRKGLAIDPRMKTAQTLLGLSDAKLGHSAQATIELTKSLAADPTNNDAELELARLNIAGGDPYAGTVRLRNYLSRNPRDQQAWYLLGKTYLQLSQDSLAKIDAIDPDSATAHLITGEVDESMRNFDGALAEYTKASLKNPDLPGIHYHLGNAFWMEEKYPSAADEFRAELKHDPNNCIAQWKLGNSILGANLPASDALPPLNAAADRCPELMQARTDRANALLKLDQPAPAMEDLKRAAQADPNEPSIHFLMSRAYKQLGKPDEARAEMQTFGKLQREAGQSAADRAKDVLSVKEQAR